MPGHPDPVPLGDPPTSVADADELLEKITEASAIYNCYNDRPCIDNDYRVHSARCAAMNKPVIEI